MLGFNIFQGGEMKSFLYDLRPMRVVLILPVFSPILLMLLFLDSLIAKLWSSQTEGKEQKRYKMILRINLVLSLIFILVWYPYFKALSE